MANILVKDLLARGQFMQNFISLFDDSYIEDCAFYKDDEVLQLKVKQNKTLKYEDYSKFNEFINTLFPCNVKVFFICNNCDLGIIEIIRYFTYIKTIINKNELEGCSITVKNKVIECLCINVETLKIVDDNQELIIELFKQFGINYDFSFCLKQVAIKESEMALPVSNNIVVSEVVENKSYKKEKKLKFDQYEKCGIKEFTDEVKQVMFTAKVFDINNILTRKGTYIQTMMVHDDEDALTCKRFEGKFTSKEDILSLKVGDTCNFYGSYVFDPFDRNFIFRPDLINKFESKMGVSDNAVNKRVELHTHSNMSEMDAISEVSELITTAFKMGHKAMAITDHMVVQAFPKAQGCVSNLLRSNPDSEFKMLYGVEMNMVDKRLKIVVNENDELFDDITYCIFDLETTGLSCKYEDIIEFGGLKVKNGEIIDRLQLFVKPTKNISTFITSKTSITNAMVANAKSFLQVSDTILAFIKDTVLVAHNASFDYGFLNESLRKNGLAKIDNCVIDTLDLARAIHSDRRNYRLGNIARLYRVVYDEEVAHRADYDAEVLADTFALMLQDCKKRGAKKISDLNTLQNEKSFIKNYNRHTTVIAKNKVGLKRLFELITISHTKTIALFGKANSKNNGQEFMAEPRILREELNTNRQDLLIGTSCYKGEIYEIAANKTQQELENALAYYDYVEIQPLENYRPSVENHMIPDFDRLKDVVLNIIMTAKKLNKIVVATGDVHYALPNQKILRDIYINTQGIGGVRHPLYIYDQQRRKNTINPSQHFRSTDEMLKEFDWLDENLAYEIVVENTNFIADSCDFIKPIHDKLFTPKVEGADELLTEICFETAHKLYGEILPEIVDERLKRELNSIIGNGFGVIYYISHLLVKKSNENGYLVGSRGSVGSSFAATMSGITEVNPLAPHYICPNCQYSEFVNDSSVSSGYDLQDKNCPKCNNLMKPDGQDIPFETFLGFEGDKVPDIDLNFSGEDQPNAHNYTKEVFGEDYVFRAGTIGTVAQKTAFGYVAGYCEEKEIVDMRVAQKVHLSTDCEGVKRTTGQHPGGIIVIPDYMDVHDFTPVNFPANNPNSEWKTTHFDFHAIHDNVLKFDILGHVDPTVMRLMQNISNIDPKSIPMNDLKTMSLFSNSNELMADPKLYNEITGAVGLPEFGTKFVRGILELTKPKTFSDLVIISGLSHGTDVWLNNAKDLVESGIELKNVIGCRDDIMVYLIQKGLPPKVAFFIMESVRKGKGLKPEWMEIMKENNVDQWYIDSCLKIKYMFPKAHAVAYVMMAVRCAWFKVHHPHYYYVAYFTLRCDAYEIETMIKETTGITSRMEDIQNRLSNIETKKTVTSKEIALYSTLENCLEMVSRGYKFSNIDINLSQASQFSVLPNDLKTIIPPFTVMDGLGENVGKSIVTARANGDFLSKEDLINRTLLSTTLVRKLEVLGVLNNMQDENQMSLF